MRASSLFRNTVILLLGAAVGGYCLTWYIGKNQIEKALQGVLEAKSGPKLDYAYQVSGFPLAYRVTLSDIRMEDGPNKSFQQFLSGAVLKAEGEMVLDYPLWAKSVTLTSPGQWQVDWPQDDMLITMQGPAKFKLEYAGHNMRFFLYSLGIRQPRKEQFPLQAFRSLSYRDAGAKIESADKSVSAEYASQWFQINYQPNGRAHHGRIQTEVKDFNTSPGYHHWLHNMQTRSNPLPPELSELILYIQDNPVYSGPVSYGLDAEFDVIPGTPPQKVERAQLDVHHLWLRDDRGEGRHSGAFALEYVDGKPKAQGKYALKVERYDEVLGAYLHWAQGFVAKTHEVDSRLLSRKGKQIPFTDPAQLAVLAPVVKTQLLGFLREMGALQSGTLDLKLELADKPKDVRVNGKTIQELAPLAQRYTQPVREAMQKAQP